MCKVFLFLTLLSGCVLAQTTSQKPAEAMPGMDMSHSQSQTQGNDMADTGQGTAGAMHSRESRHMDMGPHMKMTDLRPIQPGDKEKADQVAQAARAVAQKYQDYKIALADGSRFFFPMFLRSNITSPITHM